MNAKLEGYLKDVESRLASNSPAERADILNALRGHIAEALVRHDGDADAVLAELDQPSDYGDPAPLPARGNANRWFVLAVCFLLLNAWAVWRVTRVERPVVPAPVATTPTNAAPEVKPLEFISADQVNLTADREATLRLVFNVTPDVRVFFKYLRIKTSSTAHVAFEVVGETVSNIVLIKTETIDQDQLEIDADQGLPALNTAGVLPAPITRHVAITDRLQLQRLTAESPAFEQASLYAEFPSAIDVASAPSFIEVHPAVPFTVGPTYYGSGGCCLKGNFEPGSLYSVTFRSGLRAQSGITLTRDITRSVQFPNRPPSLVFAADGNYLSPRGKLTVPLAAMNIREVAVSVAPILPQNLVQFVMRESGRLRFYGDSADYLTGRTVTQTNALSGPANHAENITLDLRTVVGGEPHGAYLLTARAQKASTANQLVIVTDLGLSARRARDGVLVWINSLREARPVAGAEIVLYAENNRELARGKSDADGIVFLPVDFKNEEASPMLITATSGDDLSYLKLSGTEVNLYGGDGDRPFLAAGNEAYVFTDRGIYRPGETVHLKALVRDNQLACPQEFPALFRVVRPDGRVFKDVPVMLDAFGAAETNLVLADYLPTGRYELDPVLPGTFTVLGSTSIAMEEFVPPQIRVAIEGQPETATAEKPFDFEVKAAHLFGRPAAGLAVSGHVNFEPVDFTSKDWPGYRFGDNEKSFSRVDVELGKSQLADDGTVHFTVSPSVDWRPASRLRAALSATVIEASGRPVSAYGSTLLDVYPFYIGLNVADGVSAVRVGKEQHVGLIAIRPDGAPAFTNGAIKVTLVRAQWSTVLKRGSDGRYSYQSSEQLTPVKEDLVTIGAAASDYAFTVANAGSYLLTVSDPATGVSSSMRFNAATPDQEWVDVDRERPDVVELTLDKDDYAPGDTAKLLVKAPFTGTALMTLETDHVLEHRLIALEKNTVEIPIPVLAEFSPNVYCTLALIRPAVAESVWTAHRAVGCVALRVTPPDHELSIDVEAPPTNRPQTQLIAKIHVHDAHGAPARAQLTVMAVDEAICMLTDFETPDPFDYFLAPRWLGTEWFDLYSLLMPVTDEALDGAASHQPGGAGSSLLRRLNPIKAKRFKPVALWQSGVMSDSNGDAVVTFDLPEFTGELRLMAVAYDRTRFGHAQQNVKVKRPLVVETSLPRFLAPGDSCEAAVQVFNETGSDQTIQLRVTCGGPLSAESPERSFQLRAGESRVEHVTVKAAAAPGKGLCSVEVNAGAEHYAETIELAVRPAAGLQVAAEFGSLKAGESKDVMPVAGWLPETAQNTVWCSLQPDVKFGRALDYLLRYPYGCLEQTVSGAFPLLYVSDLANRMQPQSMGRDETERFMQAAVLRVISMQLYGGGFGWWPYDRQPWGWGSIYATHFLVESEKAGFDVPRDRLDAALTFLRDRLDARVTAEAGDTNADWQDDMQERAYACHVLALAGKPDVGWTARLAEQEDHLRFRARLDVAAALLLSGDPHKATDILSRLGMPDAGAPREYGGGLNSPTRDTALLLSAWLDVDPANSAVASLVQRLEHLQTDGHWQTTQEDAMALLALGKYARRVPPDTKPFTAEWVAGAATVPFDSTKPFVATNGGAIRVTNHGPGTMYFSIRNEGVPADGQVGDRDDGLSVRREWRDAQGNELASRDVKQGDLVIVKVTVDAGDRYLDNVVIEDLLPAGMEIENPSLSTSQQVPWITEKSDWCIHRELRDDRILLFTGSFSGLQTYYYAARAVTPGHFVYPSITASCMYDPGIRSSAGHGSLTVTE